MPSAASRRIFEDQIPPFMSVFDLDAETMADRDTVTVVNPKLADLESKVPSLSHHSQQGNVPGCFASDPSHKHRDSTSTQTSESADSSPTTTLSTSDCSPLSDPSPSSSPDSPLNLIPLHSLQATTFNAPSNGTALLSISEVHTLERPMTSPTPRKPRNMKGLSIQPPAAVSAMPETMVSEPCSPFFIKPQIPAMKRKPSLLSLNTNTSNLISKPTLEVPPSPAMPPILQRRALKHSTSSPHILSSLKTSTFGPPGGMTFPKVLERNESGLSEVLRPTKASVVPTFDKVILEEDSPIKTQLANRGEYEPFREQENNEDQKTPGYPDGPIAIYGDNVYLYLEPTVDEASRFDVVINVAREVKNPFDVQGRFPEFTPPTDSPIPDTGISTASFATAWESQPSEHRSADTPTTPKAHPLKAPEYMHIQWDHNTDIAPDLMRLCETIETKAKEGKKILVHCQQGASRSASLIIAYGLYQNPELSVNDAYYAAQAKSRWISPNMKLMYSLQDFHKELLANRSASASSSHRPRTGRSPAKHRLTLSADAVEVSPKALQTAPLPYENNGSRDSDSREASSRFAGKLDARQDISPGPASAPLMFSWRENLEKSTPEQKEQKEPDLKKAKQSETETPELKLEPEPETVLEPSPEAPAFLELPPPSPFKLQAPPLRPKSAQGRAKPSLAPLGEFRLKPAASHSNMGLRSYSSSLPLQASLAHSKGLNPFAMTVTVPSAFSDDDIPMSPRAEVMTNSHLRDFPDLMGMRPIPVQEPAADLFSPRQSLFQGSFFSFGPPMQMVDPRSPPTMGEAPIIRSIDDIL